MKKFYLVAVAALSLASCSNDDVMSLKQDEIKFNVVAENPSRAADVYCNNNMPVDFNMWAYWTNTAGDAIWYINEALVEKGADGYAPANTIYWPEDTYSLNFIALKNFPRGLFIDEEGNVRYGSESAQRNLLSVEEDVAKQVDMLYAVTSNQIKSVNAADGVKLNFRHALSQIVFNGKKTNSNLHIEVNGVMAGNVMNDAEVVSFPVSTLSGYVNHTGDVTDESLDCISLYPKGFVDPFECVVELDAPVVLGSESTALTSANAEGKEFSNKAMLLIPQTTTAWDPATTPKVAEEGYETFLGINCTIWNVAGDAFNATTDVKLHEGWAYIPVAYDWKPGKKYTYTFVFGNGNGGYDEDGNEVLSPMTYTVTVDDFQAVENINPEMNID